MLEPLRITAELASPVVSDGTLPIDAILYFTAMRNRYGPQLFTEAGHLHQDTPAVNVPLAKCNADTDLWYYAASFAQWDSPSCYDSTHWNKRAANIAKSDLIDFAGKRGKVIDARGRYKAYHMPIYTRHSQTVRWFVVGNSSDISFLLEHTVNIGKKTSQGWGAVGQWTVEKWHADWSIRGKQGQVMRAIPARSGLLVGFRPSYWLPTNQTICEIPLAAA